MNNDDLREVRDPAQVRLLSSPVRQEMVDTLAALGGEAGVANLADQLGRPADGLYYHLRALVLGGLVEELPGGEGSAVTVLLATAAARFASSTTSLTLATLRNYAPLPKACCRLLSGISATLWKEAMPWLLARRGSSGHREIRDGSAQKTSLR